MKTRPLLLAALWLIFLILFSLPTAHGQDTVVSYQGRVASGGTNFTGSGQFKFALVTSTNTASTATATATVNSGFVTGYTVTYGGSSYVTPPTVTVSGGGGAGATATAQISGGVVTNIVAVTAGSGYTSPPTVTLSAAPETIVYTTHWSHDGTSTAGSEPASAVPAPVADGWFTTALGDTTITNMGALSATLFQQTNLQLRVWFNDGVNGFATFLPAPLLATAPYAASATFATHASTAGTINATSNQPVNLTVNGLTVLSLTTGTSVYGTTVNSVGGYPGNIISNGVHGGFIGGGGWAGAENIVGGYFGTVVGGANNEALGVLATAMGYSTTASGDYSTAMGANTWAGGEYSTALGVSSLATGYVSTAIGYSTAARGSYTTAIGYNTEAIGIYSIAMGVSSTASNIASTAMGYQTTASGDYSTTMGFRAKAAHRGSFVWADYELADFASSTTNQFAIRAKNGLRIVNNSGNGATLIELGMERSWAIRQHDTGGQTALRFTDLTGNKNFLIDTTGNVGIGNLAPTNRLMVVNARCDGSSWINASDRDLKQSFAPVNAEEVLAKVAALPIQSWSYKAQPAQRHVGPVAQEFHAAFGLGQDDTSIATVDADGVALAAIQGLNLKLERKDAEIRDLKDAVRELQELVKALTNKQTEGVK